MTTMPVDVAHGSLLAAARALAPRIREGAPAAERDRRLSPALVEAMAEAGLFRMLVPAALGGGELDVPSALRVIEAVAHADGAAGWCLMIGAQSGIVGGFISEEAARPIYGDPRVITGGVLAPSGRAVPVAGGYRVSGRWAFTSGVEHSAWRMGACLVLVDGVPRMVREGLPEVRVVLFPAEESRVLDTWDVSGLRATGSHDMTVEEIFVPEARTFLLVGAAPSHPGSLYRFPLFGLLALGIGAVAVGIARAAIDALVELAVTKVPTGSMRPLRQRVIAQIHVAQAEGALRAGRALLYETAHEVWTSIAAGEGATTAQRSLIRLAATTATHHAVQAVDLMYDAGGGSSIYAQSPLQRCFRDIHTLTQHIMVLPATLETAGRLFMGLESDTAVW